MELEITEKNLMFLAKLIDAECINQEVNYVDIENFIAMTNKQKIP